MSISNDLQKVTLRQFSSVQNHGYAQIAIIGKTSIHIYSSAERK